MAVLDLMDPEGSLPYLVKCLKEEVEPLINTRTRVLVERYLQGWGGLYVDGPPRLTMESAILLYKKWIRDGNG